MPAHSHESSAFLTERVPAQSEIAEIIALPGNPGLRNLRITACYGELSRALAGRVGRENVNWCTFATWASRTAGRFIRLADLDERVRGAVEECLGSADASGSLRQRLRNLSGGFGLIEDRIVDAAKELAVDTSAEVAAGNVSVFAELAPLFASLITAMDESAAGKRGGVSSTIDSLKPGPTSQGGQDLLRRALSDYAEARSERDPRRKAELLLRANAQVGAHEQIRLQPHIHNAMTASLADRLAALLRGRAGYIERSSPPLSLSALVEARLRPYRMALEQVWLQVATSYLMTLELPNGTLHLGRDLPSLPGQPIFPAELNALQDAELLRILRIYHAGGPTAHGSGASIWSDLSDRMRYILELFRSRQQDQTLFEPPFDAPTRAAIHRGTVPLLGV
jgi:hypothetical protein